MRVFRFGWLLLWLLGAGAAAARANPITDPEIVEMNALPRAIADGAAPKAAARFDSLLQKFGFRFLRAEALAVIEGDFPAFRGLLLESQRPGRMLDYEVQRVFRRHATGRDRDSMCAALRGWLRRPLDDARPGFWRARVGPEHDGMVRDDELSAQMATAGMLCDWRDTRAEGDIRALIDWLRERGGSPAEGLLRYLQLDLRRMRDPDAAAFLCRSDDGTLSVVRRPGDADLVQLGCGGWRWDSPGYESPVPDSVVAHLWGLLGSGRCTRGFHTPAQAANEWAVFFRFRDHGFGACLVVSHNRQVRYIDNTRWENAVLYLDNPELAAAILEAYRRRSEGGLR